MSTHRIALVVLALSVSTLSSAATKPDLHVLSFIPSGSEASATDLRNGIQLTFDQDVATYAEVGQVVTGALVIKPAAPGEARWVDRRTLAFLPKASLEPSTTYEVRLATAFAARLGGQVPSWSGLSFVFERIRIFGAGFDGDRQYQPVRPVVQVSLSHATSPTALAAACSFCPSTATGTPCVPAVLAKDDLRQPSSGVPVRPQGDLSPQTSYVLRCTSGIKAATGDAGTAKVFQQAFSTYGPARVLKVEPSGNDVASDNVRLSLTFSTPVDSSALRNHVELVANGKDSKTIAPAAHVGRTTFTWSGDLGIATDYEIRIKAGLKDIFGQRVSAGTVGSFHVGDASPKLRMQRGVFVVERSLGRYPVWARNVDSVRLRCAEVPEARLAAVLGAPMNQETWWNASKDVKHPGLGFRPHEKTMQVRGTRNQWHDTNFDLAGICGKSAKTGVYVLETIGDTRWTTLPAEHALASVTDLGLLAKVGNASSLVWVVSLSTGRPVPGAKVKLRDPEGKLRFEGTTNADGVVQGPGADVLTGSRKRPAPEEPSESFEGDLEEDYRPRRVLVTAETEADFAVLDTQWSSGIQIWNFAVAQDRTGGKVRVRGLLHSDRGLYRPGDTVHLKGWVRLLEASGKMAVPTKKRRVHLVVTDPRNKTIVDENLAVSDFGSFHKDVKVTDEAALGDFQVRAELQGQTFSDHFSVEEYRPRTFELKVSAAKKNVLLGQALRFDLKANFLYGSPLRGGKVTYSVRRRQHLPVFRDFFDYVFQDYASQYDVGHDWARYEERSFSDLVSDGETTLDKNGVARVTVRDQDKLGLPQDYVLEATVTDETGESVSAGQMVVGHPSGLYLGLRPSECVQAVDKPFGIQVVAFDKDGNRRAATAELELTHRSYDCGPHGRQGYWSCELVPTKGPAIKRTVSIPPSGSAAVEQVTLKEPGEYVVRIVSDGKGEKAIASDVLWVVGKGEASWGGDDGDRMTVIASKADYAPGDTALLVPQARMPGALALVTLERDGIMGYTLTSLANSGQPIEVKVTPEMAPNVFASVTMVRGRTGEGDRARPRFKMGLVDLKVEATVQRLNVVVATDKPSYQPGDEVKANVRVTSASGEPVRAELALAAADEGVLQIVGFKTPDPMAAFYAPFALGVESATTWNRILRKLDPNQDDSEEGGDGGGDEAGRIRSRFMATAFWAPALVTDQDGRVEVTFKAPDNLTAFRLMAVAADQGSRFGSGEQRFTVAKPLQVIPALPRFLSPGDRMQAAVAVHNNTDEKREIELAATIEGVTVRGNTSRKLTIAAHAYRRAAFNISAQREGNAKLVFRAEAQGLEDAVEVRVPVRRAAAPETVMVGEGSTRDRVQHELPAMGPVLPGRGSLDVSLDRSGMGRLSEGLAYLVEYPYGCLEQTTSKVVPMIAISELAKNIHLRGIDAKQARGFVELGVAKILRHQSEDGGFGLWIGAQPEPQYTATGLWGLSVAKAAGFKVDEEAVKKGAAYLRKHAESAGHGNELLGQQGTRAFAAYVLASLGQADHGTLARMFEDRASLPIYGRAFLLRALLTAGRADLAKSLVLELAALVPPAGLIHEVKGELSWCWSSDVRTTALVLWALNVATPGDARLGQLAEALLASRDQGRWASTQENVFGLLALSELAKARSNTGQVTATVRLGERVLAKKAITAKSVEHLSVPLGKLGTGALVITTEGGEVFYSARLRVERPLSADSLDHGIVVERAYIDPETRAPLTEIRLGQQVLVRLSVNSPTHRAHVALVDRLPAGFEPVLERFANADDWRQGRAQPYDPSHWNTLWQNQELRDDRMQIFADTLAQGISEHAYLVRAASIGTFVAPPATVEAMYEPSVQGRSATGTVEIAK
jgi:uncharacterized protein YfaS (alpha-2-macroglobulin family)